MKNLETFFDLTKDQFLYGGKKYGLNEQRESTDVLFDAHGKNWLFGTIDKYTYRFKNLKRERDLLKIATYMYILWLKRGFFLQKRGVNDSIDTNLKIKDEQFTYFTKQVTDYINNSNINKFTFSEDGQLDWISEILKRWSSINWGEISRHEVLRIYRLTFHVWDLNFGKIKEHDTDTWNEKGK